jgi:hypothetical protein
VGKKITELPSATVLSGAELSVVVQDGATKQVAMQVVVDTVLAQAPAGLEGPPGPQGEPGPAGVAGWADLGVFVGVEEPVGLKTYAEWAATRTGYWSWIDISGEPVSNGIATLVAVTASTSVRAFIGVGTPLAALLNATATTSIIALTGAATGSLGGASIVSVSVSTTVGALAGAALGGAALVGVTATTSINALSGVAANVPPSFTSQPVALRVTNGGVHFGYGTADPDGDNYDVAYRFDNTGSWTTIWTNEAPGAGKVVYTPCAGATGSHTIALRLTARTGDATPAYSDSVAVDIPNVTIEVLGQTIGNAPTGWTNVARQGTFTVEDGAAVGSLANRVVKQYYDGTAGLYNYDRVDISTAAYTRVAVRVRRDGLTGGSSCIRIATAPGDILGIVQAEGDGHFNYTMDVGGNHLLSTDTTWVADTWQDVELRNINLSAKTADIYIDGVPKGSITLWVGWSGSSFNSFELVNWPGSGTSVNTMYLDYVNFWI